MWEAADGDVFATVQVWDTIGEVFGSSALLSVDKVEGQVVAGRSKLLAMDPKDQCSTASKVSFVSKVGASRD